MTQSAELQQTIEALVRPGHGILAADESTPTITKRFAALNIESTEESRRRYRELLMATPGVSEFISGIILFEETLGQKTSSGQPFPQFLAANNIVPGIKVDKGVLPLANGRGDLVTRGLDYLGDRLSQYKDQGARFTKWRAVIDLANGGPDPLAVKTNAEVLARYAAIAQNYGFVPIVEPEVLIDGDHTIERCAEASTFALQQLFLALDEHRVQLEYIILKPSMVISGKQCPEQASVEQVARETLTVLKRTVPAAVPSINFLSGGQTELQASAHLNLMNQLADATGDKPWNLSFSYARALQTPCMTTWAGKEDNVASAEKVFFERAQLNSLASLGRYEEA